YARDFESTGESYGGLRIRNYSKAGRFVSADLNQEFDFKTNFRISGFFTIEHDNALDPSGFDIALCDKWGEKLSIVLGDGRMNAFSIKMIGEKYGAQPVTARSENIRIWPTTHEGPVYNHFLIQIWQHGGETRCSLYVNRDTPDFSQSSFVHERIVDPRMFSGAIRHIKFKLWKAGILKLYNFEVAELRGG
ncbi:unnamed protein product, partial [marine sediment metagenome]